MVVFSAEEDEICQIEKLKLFVLPENYGKIENTKVFYKPIIVTIGERKADS